MKKAGYHIAILTAILIVLRPVLTKITYSNLSLIVSLESAKNMTTTYLIVMWAIGVLFIVTYQVVVKNNGGGVKTILDVLRYRRSLPEILEFNRNSDPYKLDTDDYPETPWYQTDGVILGTVDGKCIYRPSHGEGNLCLFARPGAGKTSAQIIPSALQFKGGVLAVDIKGDIYHATKDYRPILKFAPSDPDNSCHFDPFAGLKSMSEDDRRVRLKQLACTLIPQKSTGNSEADEYYTKGARNFFIGTALFLFDINPDIEFSDVVDIIVYNKLGNALDVVMTVVNSNCDSAKMFLARYAGQVERNVIGCYGDTVEALLPLTGDVGRLLNNRGKCISIDQLLNGWDIYLEIPQDRISTYAPVTSMIIQSFMEDFMRRDDKATGKQTRPILFLIDEFAQLNFDFSTLSTAMATLRSKNVSLFLAMQSVAQFATRYGEDATKEVIDNCSYISIMSVQDPDSQAYFSKMIGEKRVLRRSGFGSSESTEPIIPPAAFGNLDDKVVLAINGKYVIADKCYYYKDIEHIPRKAYEIDDNGKITNTFITTTL